MTEPRGPKEIRAIQEGYSRQVPAARRPLWARVVAGKASPRLAIKAKCQECVGYEDVVSRIRECTTYRCPLWWYRPYWSAKDDE